jgi:hypothetical protein
LLAGDWQIPASLEEETMSATSGAKVSAYTRYPLSSLLIYNGATALHYLLGGIGIMLGYNFSWGAYLLGFLYLTFAFVQMYVLMPLMVCPNCVYYKWDDSRCISGMNLVSRRVAGEGDVKDFAQRGEGLLCHNNLYMAAKILPIVAMIPALILNFSSLLLGIFLAVVGLLVFRIFVIFPKIACVHCRAKNMCPNAEAMGLSDRSGA